MRWSLDCAEVSQSCSCLRPSVLVLGSGEQHCFEVLPAFGLCPIQSRLRTPSSCSVAGRT